MKQDTLELEGAPILFKNFSAGPTKFNPQGGDVTFSILIEDLDQAEALLADEWALKPLMDRDEEDTVNAYHLPVKINFESPFPPRIYRVSEAHLARIAMTRDTIHILDSLRVLFCDIVVNKYRWSVGGKSGVKAYLDLGYFIIEETDLDRKWDTLFSGSSDEIEANFESLVKEKMAGK